MNIKRPLFIWGGTGQSIVLSELLCESHFVWGFFDSNKSVNSPIINIPIYHSEKILFEELKGMEDLDFVVAIGGNNGAIRVEIHKKLIKFGLKSISAIHHKSNIENSATIGDGCHILINSTICARAKIGNCVIINSSVNVDHECEIGNGVHIAPGATLAGCVMIGDNSFIGANATILPKIRIGENCIIGAGAVVIKDIPSFSTVVGNPAKIIKSNK